MILIRSNISVVCHQLINILLVIRNLINISLFSQFLELFGSNNILIWC